MAAIQAARLDRFGGGYEFRRIAGSVLLSVHGYDATIDLDPERNPLGVRYDPARGVLPPWLIDLFQAEGWLTSRADCMHFQATSEEAPPVPRPEFRVVPSG